MQNKYYIVNVPPLGKVYYIVNLPGGVNLLWGKAYYMTPVLNSLCSVASNFSSLIFFFRTT